MDIKKVIQQHSTFKEKTMSKLIAGKHKKNQQDLELLHKKWIFNTESNKKTP